MRLRLGVPLSRKFGPLIEQLRATPAEFSDEYQEAIEAILVRSGFLDSSRASLVVEAEDRLPSVTISPRVATLILVDSFPVLFNGSLEGREWSLPEIDVPDGGRLVVLMQTEEVGPAQAASPLPREDDGKGTMRWVAGPGISPAIHVRLAETSLGEHDPWPPIVAFAVDGLPFLILLLLVTVGRLSDARRYLKPLSVAGLALSIAACACLALKHLAGPPGSDLSLILGRRGVEVTELLTPALGIAAFVALPSGRRVARLIAVLAVAVGYAIWVSALPDAFGSVSGALTGREEREFVVACVLAGLLAFATVGAAVAWLADIVPELARKWRRVLPAPVRVALPALVAIGMVGQLILAAHGAPQSAPGFIKGGLSWFDPLGEMPFLLANLARNIAIVLLGIALSVWLWRRTEETELGFSTWDECAMLALLMGSSVIGLSGEIDGYEVPLAFLLSFAGTSVVVRLLSGSAWARTARDPAVRERAKSLLGQANEVAILRRERQAVIDRLTEGDIGQEAFEDEVRDLDRRRAQLFGGDALESLEPDRRARAVLAFGLNGRAGARERLTTLRSGGWWIVVMPMVYSAIAFFASHAAGAVSSGQPVGIAFLLAGIAFQVSIWPIAAWCFLLVMPILPGWIGPVKGLFAGLFCALPAGLASLVVDDPFGAGQWFFLATTLALLFAAVGLFLDYKAVRANDGDLRQLGELYRIDSARTALAYVATATTLVFGVANGLASGSGADALRDAASAVSSAASK